MWDQNTEGTSAGVNRLMASISRKSQHANWESWKGLLLGVWFSAGGLTKHQAVLRAHNETHPSWNVDSLRCQKADLIGLVPSPAVAITMAGFIFLNLRMARLSLQSSTWWVEEIAADIVLASSAHSEWSWAESVFFISSRPPDISLRYLMVFAYIKTCESWAAGDRRHCSINYTV